MKYSRHLTSVTQARRALSIFGFLSLAFVLAGCLSRPAMKTQTFAFSEPLLVATNSVPGGRVLGIRALQIDPPFDGRSLVYRTGENSYERDPYAQFLSDPAEELTAAISGLLSSDRTFKTVVEMGSAATPDTFVEFSISQLYGDIRKPGSPYSVLAMQVIFVNATNGLPGKVILQRSYSRRIPVKSPTAAAFMTGWNQALAEIITEVESDFRRRETVRTNSQD